ncbi:MAG: hypothetical protein ABI600_04420 [Luteolibacter sp.]
MVEAHRKKGFPITLGAICLIVAIAVSFYVETDKITKGLWAPLGLFFIGGVVMICSAFRKVPVIKITADQVIIEGIEFERSNIRSARVFRMWRSSSRGRYVELGFDEMPSASSRWKTGRLFKMLMFPFPTQCENGVKFVMEPMVIIPISDTDLSDDELNHRFNSEQGGRGDGDKPPI